MRHGLKAQITRKMIIPHAGRREPIVNQPLTQIPLQMASEPNANLDTTVRDKEPAHLVARKCINKDFQPRLTNSLGVHPSEAIEPWAPPERTDSSSNNLPQISPIMLGGQHPNLHLCVSLQLQILHRSKGSVPSAPIERIITSSMPMAHRCFGEN